MKVDRTKQSPVMPSGLFSMVTHDLNQNWLVGIKLEYLDMEYFVGIPRLERYTGAKCMCEV